MASQKERLVEAKSGTQDPGSLNRSRGSQKTGHLF